MATQEAEPSEALLTARTSNRHFPFKFKALAATAASLFAVAQLAGAWGQFKLAARDDLTPRVKAARNTGKKPFTMNGRNMPK